jgi:hypothetical protein
LRKKRRRFGIQEKSMIVGDFLNIRRFLDLTGHKARILDIPGKT